MGSIFSRIRAASMFPQCKVSIHIRAEIGALYGDSEETVLPEPGP